MRMFTVSKPSTSMTDRLLSFAQGNLKPFSIESLPHFGRFAFRKVGSVLPVPLLFQLQCFHKEANLGPMLVAKPGMLRCGVLPESPNFHVYVVPDSAYQDSAVDGDVETDAVKEGRNGGGAIGVVGGRL